MKKSILALALLATAFGLTACSSKNTAGTLNSDLTPKKVSPAATMLPVMITYDKDAFTQTRMQKIITETATKRGWNVWETALGTTDLVYRERPVTITYAGGILSIATQDRKAKSWAEKLAKDIKVATSGATQTPASKTPELAAKE